MVMPMVVTMIEYNYTQQAERTMTVNDGPMGPRTMMASEFKAKCLKLMDEVSESGEEIVITKNGKPVAKLVPHREKPESWFGRDRDKIKILGDIISPIDVEWEAESDPDRLLNP
jgi:prevent-host-death family protein